jgi:uroporphyrinogen-III synthase
MRGALSGCRIVVPESRDLDLFVGMLERHGAATIRCPLVTIHDVEDATPVETWLQRLASGRHDDLIFLTGEGVTRLIGFAHRAGLEEGVLAGMARARKIVRGPKPTRALRAVGLSPELVAEAPTTDGVIATLTGLDLEGRTVGVQLYPGSPDALVQFLTNAGAQADPIQCYRYASDVEDARVSEVIRLMAAGDVDLIAFTSTPQIRRLQEVARQAGLEPELAQAMERTRIAAIGPVTAEAVEKVGWRVSISPPDSFHLKPLITEMIAEFGRQSPAA